MQIKTAEGIILYESPTHPVPDKIERLLIMAINDWSSRLYLDITYTNNISSYFAGTLIPVSYYSVADTSIIMQYGSRKVAHHSNTYSYFSSGGSFDINAHHADKFSKYYQLIVLHLEYIQTQLTIH